MSQISPDASIAEGVELESGCIIESGVKIGKNSKIAHGAIIKSGTEMGENNEIHAYAVIGDTPQDKSFQGNKGKVVIGDSNIIREFTTIHSAVKKDDFTEIGSGNYIMAYSHIAHNCVVGDDVLLVNGATLGGYVEVHDHAYISAFVPVHQWVRVGAYSLIGGGFRITKDLIPFALAAGEPLRVVAPNTVGLRRSGFSRKRIKSIKEAFKILFRSNLNTSTAVEKLKEEFSDNKDIEKIIKFIENDKKSRGLVKGG